MAHETSIDDERRISAHLAEHGPADYARWMRDFAAFRNRVLSELDKARMPDEWLVRASLAASRAWEAQNPCPVGAQEIERLRCETAQRLGF